ncbi:MAG: glycosyltransferase [Bacteroidales bacterium]|nr:glycosyltransferase [Bacteroidales bacterium]
MSTKDKNTKAILSVTNDIETDRRVHKIALALMEMGYEVTIVGRKRPWSNNIDRPYKTHRFKLIFSKKMWFYAEFNIRLFFYLLFHKADVLVANDLDTLLPNYLISKFKNKPLVYDSHEYFTEVPELIQRPRIRRVWLTIERWIFPKLKHVYTVNQSIAEIYRNLYKVNVKVVRNINPKVGLSFKSEIIEPDKKLLIMQGAGINIDRGAEELILAMQWVEYAVLYIIGSGDVFESLKDLVTANQLENKVKILDRMPYQELMQYTQQAYLGFSLDKGSNPNYELSLPNKLFDYIHAGTPIICSNRKEVASLVKKYDIGLIIDYVDSKIIANAINKCISDENTHKSWCSNIVKASKELSWENEKENLFRVYSNIIK